MTIGQFRAYIFISALIISVVASDKTARNIGDHWQVALPLVGLACALGTGNAGGVLARFVGLNVLVQGSKHALGDAQINRRPNGKLHGFPSGHSAAAGFGASVIMRECVGNAPALQVITLSSMALGTAGFVGYSRIESRNHTIWQVLVGLALGFVAYRLPLKWRKPR